MVALPEYPFASLNRRIEEEQRSGRDIVSLGIGDPDGSPPGVVLQAVTASLSDPSTHRYPSNNGAYEFRASVSDFYARRFGVRLDPAREVMPVLGAKEAIAHICLAFLDRGDVVLAPEPGYPLYRVSPSMASAEVLTLPLTEQNGFFPDLETCHGSVDGRRCLIFLNYPNNPTGATVRSGGFAQVVSFAREVGALVIHDASYTELTFGEPAPSFLETPGARDVGVEIFSLSKGWNLSGWRVGAIVGHCDVLERFHRLKSNFDQGMPSVAQVAARAALEQAPEFPRLMAARYSRRAIEVTEAVQGAGLRGAVPAATPYLWLRGPSGMTGEQVAEDILSQAGVIVTPGSSFGPSGGDFVRLSLTVDDETLEVAAGRLATVEFGRDRIR